ncbi:MAG: hypothetical protein HY735_12590 [Verrucomicrobia bacterium]|nr:hypothetical protein [Verrucomicrobiota bacterium]
MKRALGLVVVLVSSAEIVSSQGYRGVPRQPYPARPFPAYTNRALTNYYLQRPGMPGARPFATNALIGGRTNVAIPGIGPTNYGPAGRFLPNRPYATNFAPGNRLGPNPYSFTNVLPRAGYATNVSPFAPNNRNLPGFTTSATNFVLTNALNTGTNAVLPGATNFLLPNPTNAPSRAALTPAQRLNIDRLAAVLHGIRIPPVNNTQRYQILSTLRASVLGPIRPPDAAIDKVVDDLIGAWPSKGLTFQQKFQLALDLNRVLNAENLSEAEVLMVVNDARRVLQTAGVARESVNTLIDDMTAIAGAVRKTTTEENRADTDAGK